MNPSAAPLTSNYQRDTVQARFTLLIETHPGPIRIPQGKRSGAFFGPNYH